MKKKMLPIMLIVSVLCGLSAGCGQNESLNNANNTSEQRIVETMPAQEETEESQTTCEEQPDYIGMQTFSRDLFRQSLSETNPMLSPVSAYMALSLAGSGASGNTAAEFDAVLGGNRQANCEDLMLSLPTDQEGMQIVLANSSWIDDRLKVNEKWISEAADAYRSEIFQSDLSTEETKANINGWVTDKTKGMITDLLNAPLSEECRLALFNTIYFKGKWVSPFEAQDTQDWSFFLDGGEEIQVPAMRKYDKELSYVSADDCQGIVLDYEDSDLVFVALKSADKKPIRELYEELTLEELCDMVNNAEDKRVDLILPKFKVTFDRTLNDDLCSLGLKQAFDEDQADFSKMGTGEKGNLYISLVRQKAMFILDEEGTEASAVTAVMIKENCALVETAPPIPVHFDEPFLYMILDKEKGIPLFMGIMDDPSAAEL